MNETKKIEIMIQMQCDLNANTKGAGLTWAGRGLDFDTALFVECGELLEHYKVWKWWKDQGLEPDVKQMELEFVDIWHFYISLLIVSMGVDKVLNKLDFMLIDTHGLEFPETLTGCVKKFYTTKEAPIFIRAMAFIGMDFDKLFNLYVAKNTLNRFRQANGYAEKGKYKKIWNGREDNEVLYDIAMQLDGGEDPEKLTDVIYEKLTTEYSLL